MPHVDSRNAIRTLLRHFLDVNHRDKYYTASVNRDSPWRHEEKEEEEEKFINGGTFVDISR
jgi:hypothetical protein